MAELLGDEAPALLAALEEEPPVSIRLNPDKHKEVEGTPVPWSRWGRYLAERPVFTLDPLLHGGAYYVQEASSMLLEQAVAACGALPDEAVVLDLCAAPGGKATHLAALVPEKALLIANEMVGSRLAALTENLWKWGRPGTIITHAAPAELAANGAFCDLIVVDAPCSGEGMFRKDPHARAQWGTNLVETCALRQRDILEHAWAMLKPGGHLIYSTCTWETSENEDQVKRLIDRQEAERVAVPMDEAWGVVPTDGGWRCYPHRVRGEGFFISVLRKPAGQVGAGLQASGAFGMEELPEPLRSWLHEPEEWGVVEMEGTWYAVRRRWARGVEALRTAVRVTAPGLPLAVPKGTDRVPHPALALSTTCDHGAFHVLDLGREQALSYLRGEALPAEMATGTALVRHEGLGLGWAQGAGNRWNNRWPTPWRIRMR